MNPIPLKLARPREVPLLKMAGYEVVMVWDQSFVLMLHVNHRVPEASPDTQESI